MFRNSFSRIIILFMLFIIITIIFVVSASQPTTMSLQGKATNKLGNLVDKGNLTVLISTNNTCNGNIFNQTYINNITNGIFDILLGSVSQLNLSYNEDYYMCAYVNGESMGIPYRFRGGQGQISSNDLTDDIEINKNLIVKGTGTWGALVGGEDPGVCPGSMSVPSGNDMCIADDLGVNDLYASSSIFTNSLTIGDTAIELSNNRISMSGASSAEIDVGTGSDNNINEFSNAISVASNIGYLLNCDANPGQICLRMRNDNNLNISAPTSSQIQIGSPYSINLVARLVKFTGLLRLQNTDSPLTCNSTMEASVYYDSSLRKPCFCNSTKWNQFDGGGEC